MTREPENRTSHRIVALLFFGTYFIPLILWVGYGLHSGGWREVSQFNLIITAWMYFYFPSGLYGFISDSKNMGGLAALGYIMYGVLFFLAFRLREYWQTILLWVVLVGLLVLNAAGCKSVAEHATRGMTLP